jgi:hypothetical protein
LNFRPQQIRGHGLEPAAVYLKRAAALDIKQHPAWDELNRLQYLRNLLVHKGGKQGDSPEDKKKFEGLLQAYPREKLSLGENVYTLSSESEIWISLHLCRDFVRTIEGFFKRLCTTLALPDKGVWISS